MKKIIIPIILFVIIAFVVLIFFVLKNSNKENSDSLETTNNNSVETSDNISSNIENTNIMENEEKTEDNTINKEKVEDMETIYIKVNNQILDVELEDNSAAKELKDKLKTGDITIEAHEYGGFEKVGVLGFSLPREDTNITTTAGDIVLYQGNQISILYNSNSWSYTKLGKIQNITTNELKNILGKGDVNITFTLSI